ncbi:Uncharacterized protein PBTT_05370 [Plasmodiophora brassicae]
MAVSSPLTFDCGLDLSIAKQWDHEVSIVDADIQLDFDWSLDSRVWNDPQLLVTYLKETCDRISHCKGAEVARRLHCIRRWAQSHRLSNDDITLLIRFVIVPSSPDVQTPAVFDRIPSDLIAAFVCSLLPRPELIIWIERHSCPDPNFLNALRRRNAHVRIPPVGYQAPPILAADCDIDRIERLCSALHNAWEQSATATTRLNAIDLVLAGSFPVRHRRCSPASTPPPGSPPDLAILCRLQKQISQMDVFQHPALFYWIDALKKLKTRLLDDAMASSEPAGKVRVDYVSRWLVIHSHINILRMIGLKYAFACMVTRDPDATNKFLCALLNDRLPPI